MLPFSVRACIGSAGVALDYGQAHWFHVSKASIEELQRIVNDYSGSSDGSPLDSARSYALLATLADMCISRAERKHADSRSAFAKLLSAIGTTVTSYMGSDAAGARNHVLLNTVHVHEFLQPSIKDTRFIGNPLIMHPIATPLEQLKHKTEPKLYAQTVQYYESEMARIDLRMVSGFIDMVDRNPAAHANLATFALTAPSVLSVIDERRYGMHRVDFGCGAPSWVSGIPRHMPNLVAMFTQPADSSTGGVHLFVTLRPGVINHLLADSFFTTYAEFLY
ncbi:hypothetical protein GGI07_003343 [Coemansia sp. Benny D115]|nr:hypothetical protein GGI07_003343 [Coemansia sp. Benny D115]